MRQLQSNHDVMKGIEAHIHVREGASRIYLTSRPVPYALREAVEVESSSRSTAATG